MNDSKRNVLGTVIYKGIDLSQVSDEEFEAWPEFDDLREHMTHQFFSVEDPEFLALLKRVKVENE